MEGKRDKLRISLEDVARLSGVSTATVSRVLNGNVNVRESRKAAVEDACRQLGYVVNRAASTLASRKSMTIGVVVPMLSMEPFARVIDAFQEPIHQQGYTLLLANAGFDTHSQPGAVNKLLGYGADALMFLGNHPHSGMWDQVLRHNIPFTQVIAVDRRYPGIDYDSLEASCELLRHLTELGHTKFAIISGELSAIHPSSAFIRSISAGLCEAGLLPGAENCIKNVSTVNDARQAFFRLLEGEEPPTAIICDSDRLASGVIRAAAEYGLRIPEDISITGFYDYEYAEYSEPALTTIRIDPAKAGRLAAGYLLASLRGESPAHWQSVAAKLIIRNSTGIASRP